MVPSLGPVITPVAVEIDAVVVRAPAVATALSATAAVGVCVGEDEELVVRQQVIDAGAELGDDGRALLGVAAELLNEAEAGLDADHFTRVLAEEEERTLATLTTEAQGHQRLVGSTLPVELHLRARWLQLDDFVVDLLR